LSSAGVIELAALKSSACACYDHIGLPVAPSSTLWRSAVQRAIPSHLMGRVIGLLLFGSFGVYLFSVAPAGALSDRLGPAIFFPFSGLLLALALLFGITHGALREL
jgi:hypothetical protein